MSIFVIHNPYANRWKSGQRREEIISALKEAGLDFEIYTTQGRNHATELAIHAVEAGVTTIVVAGGDGTIGEVVTGIGCALEKENTPWPSLGILPTGTANDLVCNLGLPLELPAMARIIAAGHTRRMDVGRVNGHYFANNAAVGLEPYITTLQERITWIKGDVRYVVATVQSILHNPQYEMQLQWEGGAFTGPVTLVSVGNHRRTGGTFYMTPHADGFDGLLTFAFGYAPTRRRLLQLLPKTMKPEAGNYVYEAEIREVNSPWLKVHCEPFSPCHADGELFTRQGTDFFFEVLPGRLPVLMPPP